MCVKEIAACVPGQHEFTKLSSNKSVRPVAKTHCFQYLLEVDLNQYKVTANQNSQFVKC